MEDEKIVQYDENGFWTKEYWAALMAKQKAHIAHATWYAKTGYVKADLGHTEDKT